MSFGNNVYNTVNGNSGTSFTPSISFGNGTTGITYGAQNGYYQRIGNICFFSLFLELTSKGSSTGSAILEGLPFASSSNKCRLYAVTKNVDIPANYYSVLLDTRSGQTRANIYVTGDNNAVGLLTDAEFANDSQIICSGFYFV